MKYAVEMSSGAVIYIPSLIKIGLGTQKSMVGGDIQTHGHQGYLIHLFFSMAFPPHSGAWPLIQFPDLFTIGRTPWASDQPVARPLPKHRTTQTQNKRVHTPNIHALSGIRTHDPSVRENEDSSCLRPHGHCDQRSHTPTFVF
jgi:hypothetical protein